MRPSEALETKRAAVRAMVARFRTANPRVFGSVLHGAVAHPEIPWAEIRGLRNRIAHDYFELNFEVIWNTFKFELPPLHGQIIKLVAGEA